MLDVGIRMKVDDQRQGRCRLASHKTLSNLTHGFAGRLPGAFATARSLLSCEAPRKTEGSHKDLHRNGRKIARNRKSCT